MPHEARPVRPFTSAQDVDIAGEGIDLNMHRGLGREIVRRVLNGVDGRKGAVVVRIGQPVQTAEDEWACPYAISGIGLHGFRRAFGVDSLQSLLMALEAARVALAPHRARLTWLSGEPGAFGLTQSAPTEYGQLFAEHVERLIERETLRPRSAVRRRSMARLKRSIGPLA